jgi:hypothetical protein
MTVDHHLAPQSTIGQVIARILSSGCITTADKNYLLRAVLSEIPLSRLEQDQVRQVFDRVRMGLVRVVD